MPEPSLPGEHTHPSKWILMLLAAGGATRRYNEPVAGRTRLIKELFLLREAFGITRDFYAFEADLYGPNSDAALADLRDLQTRNLIRFDPERFGGTYELTPEGLRIAQEHNQRHPVEVQKILAVKRRFNTMPLSRLLVYVYTQYPKYTHASRIRADVLRDAENET